MAKSVQNVIIDKKRVLRSDFFYQSIWYDVVLPTCVLFIQRHIYGQFRFDLK